jgi:hypothetical protein
MFSQAWPKKVRGRFRRRMSVRGVSAAAYLSNAITGDPSLRLPLSAAGGWLAAGRWRLACRTFSEGRTGSWKLAAAADT